MNKESSKKSPKISKKPSVKIFDQEKHGDCFSYACARSIRKLISNIIEQNSKIVFSDEQANIFFDNIHDYIVHLFGCKHAHPAVIMNYFFYNLSEDANREGVKWAKKEKQFFTDFAKCKSNTSCKFISNTIRDNTISKNYEKIFYLLPPFALSSQEFWGIMEKYNILINNIDITSSQMDFNTFPIPALIQSLEDGISVPITTVLSNSISLEDARAGGIVRDIYSHAVAIHGFYNQDSQYNYICKNSYGEHWVEPRNFNSVFQGTIHLLIAMKDMQDQKNYTNAELKDYMHILFRMNDSPMGDCESLENYLKRILNKNVLSYNEKHFITITQYGLDMLVNQFRKELPSGLGAGSFVIDKPYFDEFKIFHLCILSIPIVEEKCNVCDLTNFKGWKSFKDIHVYYDGTINKVYHGDNCSLLCFNREHLVYACFGTFKHGWLYDGIIMQFHDLFNGYILQKKVNGFSGIFKDNNIYNLDHTKLLVSNRLNTKYDTITTGFDLKPPTFLDKGVYKIVLNENLDRNTIDKIIGFLKKCNSTLEVPNYQWVYSDDVFLFKSAAKEVVDVCCYVFHHGWHS